MESYLTSSPTQPPDVEPIKAPESVVKQLVTDEKDNHDIVLYSILLALVVGIGLTIYSVGWRGAVFSFSEFGIGVGSILGGGGAGYLAKRVGDKNNVDATR